MSANDPLVGSLAGLQVGDVTWLLENADPQSVARTLAALPEAVRTAYHTWWQPDYSVLDRWSSQA